jgi:hypothetical protein
VTAELLLAAAAALLAAAAGLILILCGVIRRAAARAARREAETQLAELIRQLESATARLSAAVGEHLGRMDRAASGAADGPADRPAAPPPRSDTILRLRREGMDPVQIARQVGTGLGEVELVLKLNRPPERLQG